MISVKITINPDNLVCNESFQVFHKVRAIIENEAGEFIISNSSESIVGELGALRRYKHALEGGIIVGD